MKKSHILYIILGVAILIFLIYKSLPLIRDIRESRLQIKHCRQLQIGMTEKQVIDIMGPVYSRENDLEQGTDFIDFKTFGPLADPVGVGMRDGHVVGISCG